MDNIEGNFTTKSNDLPIFKTPQQILEDAVIRTPPNERSLKERVEEWAEDNPQEIQEVANSLYDNTTVILEGASHSGKTTAALAIARELERLCEQSEKELVVFVTTPALNGVFGAKTAPDRTGIQYEPLPSSASLAKLNKEKLIIIDETTNRVPNKYVWGQYIQVPNTHFLLLSQYKNAQRDAWIELFPKDAIVEGDMGSFVKKAA